MRKYSKKQIVICLLASMIALIVIVANGCGETESTNKKDTGKNAQVAEEKKEDFKGDKKEGSKENQKDKEKEEGQKSKDQKTEKNPSNNKKPGTGTSQTPATPSTPNQPLPSTAQGILNTMTLEEKVYQMFIVLPEAITNVSPVTQSGEVTRKGIQTYPVGGIIYMSQNIKNPSQCKSMISGIQSYTRIPLFISVDEEGGRVARIGNNPDMGTTKFPGMGSITTTDGAYNVGRTIGSDIRQFGFNLDFAPVADVNSNINNQVMGDRSFGSDAHQVAVMVAAAVRGFRDSNTLCTLKHFPGHGDTSNDSHNGYTELNKTLQELEEVEFVPFREGINAGADFVMMGHLSVPKVTGNGLPATLSPTMVGILRNNLGFKGLIITDAMNMGAIVKQYTSAQAAVMAVQAGIDVILMPKNLQEAANGVIQAVRNGTISEARINDSVLRILQTKINHGII